MADAEDLKLVAKHFTEGRYAEAEELCAAVVARSPANGRAFYLHALSSYKNGHPDKASDLFRKAVELNPKDFDSLFNLGVLSWELKRYKEAIAVYREVLDKAPHYTKALPNLAQALAKTGQMEEGIALFRRAIELDPKDMQSAGLLLETECLSLPMQDRIAACNKALSFAGLPDSLRHTALLYRGTAEWTMRDDAALEDSLSVARDIPPQHGDQGFINMLIYKTFLTRLLEYRKANHSLYEGNGKPLYMFGDSHSLGYAGMHVRLEGEERRIDSTLIIGAKAWHIASTEPDMRRAAFARHISRLPQGASLLCAFGEIDCRANDGILRHWQKAGGALEDIVAEQVESYVAAVTEIAAGRSPRLSFLAVPAPLPITGERQQVIALFNRELEKRAGKAGHRYVDLYTPTLGQDGVSHGKLHIDNYHLKPEALKLALA